MNKELLYAPLVECRDNYNSFFEKEKTQGKVQESEMERFKKQYKIIDQIIVTLDNDP